MSKAISRLPIIDACVGCDNVMGNDDTKECRVFLSPTHKWSGGHCNMATHVKADAAADSKVLNPLKASKLKAKGKL